MISRDDRSCRLQRVFFPKNGVSGCNRRLRRCDSIMHVAKINHPGDLSRLRPRLADQHVVVVRIAVNHPAPQAQQIGNHFRFIQRQKLFHQRAPFRISNVPDILLDPTGTRRIPFQFAMRSGMRKRLQRRIHLAKKPAKIAKQLRRMRTDFRKNFSVHEAEQPDESRRAVRRDSRRKQFTRLIGNNAGQGQLRCTPRQMLQRPALHINEGLLPRRMHHFEDESMSVPARQVEIVVVFAR